MPDGSDWNTYNSSNWAVGATDPGYGNPVLDGFDSVDLPDGEYYVYMASNGDPGATAVQNHPGIQRGQPGCGGLHGCQRGCQCGRLNAGFRFGLHGKPGNRPANDLHRCGHWQVYHSTGTANWIIDLNSGTSAPEPGSCILLAAGLAGLALRRRKPSA